MERTVLASRLVEIAGDMAALAEVKASEVTGFNQYAALRDIREAQGLVLVAFGHKPIEAADRVRIDQMPGFSPMQLRQQINRIVEARHRAVMMRAEFEETLKTLSGLEEAEKAGLDKLKEAARQCKDKEKFLVEAEKGILEFTAFVQKKRPGVEQMLANPDTVKSGLKAGDFFKRIGEKLGAQVQEAVETIYSQTEEDLTHMADCVSGLKVIEKTASVHADTIRMAGLSDVLISVKEWLGGRVNSMAARMLNFAGDIGRFVRGFTERTGLVKKATNDLQDAFDEAEKELENLMQMA
jgi:hypothetical protein